MSEKFASSLLVIFIASGCTQQAMRADWLGTGEESGDANRNAYFGDLHIHTAYSYDARPPGTRTTPADAYRFARGEAIPIPPYAEDGAPLMTRKLKRPLDFAAVTDHSEFFGEMTLCFDEDSPAYEVDSCKFPRGVNGEGLSPFIRIVFDVAGQKNNEGEVDLQTGAWSGTGSTSPIWYLPPRGD